MELPRRKFLHLAIGAGALPAWLDAAQFADLGSVPIPMTPAAFGKFIGDEIDKWRSVIRAANIKLE